MPSLRPRLLLAALFVPILLAAPPAVPAQGFFDHFEFDQLTFEFIPEGLPRSTSSDPEGSTLRILVENLTFRDWDALDLRYCIDGQDACPFPAMPWTHNRNGTVETEEVRSFERSVAPLVRHYETVSLLLEAIQNNITVDGKMSARPTVQSVHFDHAEGPIDSRDPIVAQIEVLARYDNDRDARTHEIRVNSLPLRQHGFEYERVIWVVNSSGSWKFASSATQPPEAASRVNTHGWFSDQTSFETFADQGVLLEVARESGGGKSPAPGMVLVALGLLGAAAAVRRRRG